MDYKQADTWAAKVDGVYHIFHAIPTNTSSHQFAPAIANFANTLSEFLGTFNSSIQRLSNQHIAGLCEYLTICAKQCSHLASLVTCTGFNTMQVNPVPPQYEQTSAQPAPLPS